MRVGFPPRPRGAGNPPSNNLEALHLHHDGAGFVATAGGHFPGVLVAGVLAEPFWVVPTADWAGGFQFGCEGPITVVVGQGVPLGHGEVEGARRLDLRPGGGGLC